MEWLMGMSLAGMVAAEETRSALPDARSWHT